MNSFGAGVDGPPLTLTGRKFSEDVEITAQPTYGRIIFTQHDVLVKDCIFEEASLLLHTCVGLQNVSIIGCVFSFSAETPSLVIGM